MIDYSDGTWVDQVKQLTGGRGADVIYDPVGGDIFDLSTKCIAPGGRLLVIGFASGRIPTIAANRILIKDIAIVGALWGPYAAAHPDYLAAGAEGALAWSGAGPPKPQCYPLDQAPPRCAIWLIARFSAKPLLPYLEPRASAFDPAKCVRMKRYGNHQSYWPRDPGFARQSHG